MGSKRRERLGARALDFLAVVSTVPTESESAILDALLRSDSPLGVRTEKRSDPGFISQVLAQLENDQVPDALGAARAVLAEPTVALCAQGGDGTTCLQACIVPTPHGEGFISILVKALVRRPSQAAGRTQAAAVGDVTTAVDWVDPDENAEQCIAQLEEWTAGFPLPPNRSGVPALGWIGDPQRCGYRDSTDWRARLSGVARLFGMEVIAVDAPEQAVRTSLATRSRLTFVLNQGPRTTQIIRAVCPKEVLGGGWNPPILGTPNTSFNDVMDEVRRRLLDRERPEDQVSCITEAVEMARQQLGAWLVIPSSAPRELHAIDVAVNARAWGTTAWRGLKALAAYAEEKASHGFNGDFRAWCRRGGGSWPATSKKLAMRESKTVNENDGFSRARNFDIDTAVDAADTDGELFMQAHLKISEGGGNLAPRIYFHDDTDGRTGKVHVGFIGPHYLVRNTKS